MSSPSSSQAAASTPPPEESTTEELRVQLELLREQNQRLRDQYLRAQQQRYRRAAAALVLIGVGCVAAGVLFVAAQTVLFALGGIGIFGGVLTYSLTPERFIAESVSGGIYEALATDRDRMRSELDLAGEPVYLPTSEPTLYLPTTDWEAIPQTRQPSGTDLASLFVAGDSVAPGVALTPVGSPLFREFEQALTASLADTPASLVAQLTEALVTNFELVDAVDTDVDPAGDRVTVELSGVAYGQLDRIDHPVWSFLATGLAVGLSTPIHCEVTDPDAGLVTFRWDPDASWSARQERD